MGHVWIDRGCGNDQRALVNFSELGVQARREDRSRSAFAIVGGVFDESIVNGDVYSLADRNVVIGLKKPLVYRVGRFAIAHQDKKAARVMKCPVAAGGAFGDQS